jgi:hypothetical protein
MSSASGSPVLLHRHLPTLRAAERERVLVVELLERLVEVRLVERLRLRLGLLLLVLLLLVRLLLLVLLLLVLVLLLLGLLVLFLLLVLLVFSSFLSSSSPRPSCPRPSSPRPSCPRPSCPRPSSRRPSSRPLSSSPRPSFCFFLRSASSRFHLALAWSGLEDQALACSARWRRRTPRRRARGCRARTRRTRDGACSDSVPCSNALRAPSLSSLASSASPLLKCSSGRSPRSPSAAV